MKRGFIAVIVIVMVIIGIIWAGAFVWDNIKGALPALLSPSQDIAELLDRSTPIVQDGIAPLQSNPPQEIIGSPLALLPGFSISIFAKNLSGARVMAFDLFGNLWVSQTKEGTISLLEVNGNRVISADAVFENLRNPHGLAFDPEDPSLLYFAEENKVSRVRVYSDGEPETLVSLPSNEGHFTRTLGFGPDGRLYVSIGSSCNVCNESDPRRAAIYSMRKDGSDFKLFAEGLRNAVFFTWHPATTELWVTEMGRDLLGDNLPPDEINIVKEGRHYGWPFCYGKNVQDLRFDSSINAKQICEGALPAHLEIPAHSAPLGFVFIPNNIGWPQEYWRNLLVAYHGSWNRNVPTGYKIVRFKLDKDGSYVGGTTEAEDFVTGWFTLGEVLGRPVAMIFGPDGALYVSDDKAGVIYRIVHAGQRE